MFSYSFWCCSLDTMRMINVISPPESLVVRNPGTVDDRLHSANWEPAYETTFKCLEWTTMDHFLIAFIDLLHILIFSPFDLHDGSHSLWMYLFTRGFHRVSPPCYCCYILSMTVQGIASSCLLYSTPNIALTVACGPDLGHTHSTSPHNWIHPILKTLYYSLIEEQT